MISVLLKVDEAEYPVDAGGNLCPELEDDLRELLECSFRGITIKRVKILESRAMD